MIEVNIFSKRVKYDSLNMKWYKKSNFECKVAELVMIISIFGMVSLLLHSWSHFLTSFYIWPTKLKHMTYFLICTYDNYAQILLRGLKLSKTLQFFANVGIFGTILVIFRDLIGIWASLTCVHILVNMSKASSWWVIF